MPAEDVKIRGYVTELRSPTDFDIEDYRISRDEAFTLDFENASPEITFELNDIRVGVELEIKGTLNEQTGELKAKAIKVDLEQFKSIKQTAFVSAAARGHSASRWHMGGRTARRRPGDSGDEQDRRALQADKA